jgi:hypothetical protein
MVGMVGPAAPTPPFGCGVLVGVGVGVARPLGVGVELELGATALLPRGIGE